MCIGQLGCLVTVCSRSERLVCISSNKSNGLSLISLNLFLDGGGGRCWVWWSQNLISATCR